MADYGYDPNNPKTPPGYLGPSTQTNELLQQFIAGIGNNPQYASAMQGMTGALGQKSGFDVIQGMLPMLGKFLAGGGKAADAYQTAGLGAVNRAFTQGRNQLGGAMGQGGNLGSTLAGVSLADLGGRTLEQANNVRASAAGMREQNIQNRLGLGMQGLGALGNSADIARQTGIQGYGQQAGLAQNQGQIDQGQYLSGFQNSLGLDQGPMNQANMIWQTLMGMPKSPSGLDVLGGVAQAALPFFLMA